MNIANIVNYMKIWAKDWKKQPTISNLKNQHFPSCFYYFSLCQNILFASFERKGKDHENKDISVDEDNDRSYNFSNFIYYGPKFILGTIYFVWASVIMKRVWHS